MTQDQLKSKILADFKENFPTKEQIFNQGKGTWDFTEYFDEKLLKSLDQMYQVGREETRKAMTKDWEAYMKRFFQYLFNGEFIHGQDQNGQEFKVYKDFLKAIRKDVLREVKEVLPKKKSRLENVLEGKDDLTFEENGMDGVIGYNQALAEVRDILEKIKGWEKRKQHMDK